jgi:hypothetical protein
VELHFESMVYNFLFFKAKIFLDFNKNEYKLSQIYEYLQGALRSKGPNTKKSKGPFLQFVWEIVEIAHSVLRASLAQTGDNTKIKRWNNTMHLENKQNRNLETKKKIQKFESKTYKKEFFSYSSQLSQNKDIEIDMRFIYNRQHNTKKNLPSCGNLTTPLLSDGDPSPTRFTADTRN